MKNHRELPFAFITLALCLNYFVSVHAQSNCYHHFKENDDRIKSTAFKSVVLSNGDLVTSGYRKVSGFPKIVVDRYSPLTCSLTATYTFPYYSGPPAAAQMQLLINNNDFIGIRYFDTKPPGYTYFIILDSNLNNVSTRIFNNSVTNRLMAFTNDGGVIFTLLSSAPSFGEKLKVRKVLQSNLNTMVWNTPINFTNAEVRMVSDIKTDSSNNVYVTGCIENDNGELELFVLKVNASGQEEWIKSFKLNNPDWSDWLFTCLTVDKQQRCLIGSKSTDGVMCFLNVYCLEPDGTLSWKRKKQTGAIHSNKVWIDTDSLGNVYASAHLTGAQNYPSSVTYKFNQTGNEAWKKNLYNFRVNSMKTSQGGDIYLAGDRLSASVNYTAYRSHFKLLNTDGLIIDNENQPYTYDTNTIASSYSKYNDVAFTINNDAFFAGERHDMKYNGTDETDYYFIDSYESNIPKTLNALNENDVQSCILPNPAFDEITINLSISEPFKVFIMDLNGNVLIEKVIYSGEQIKIDALSKGIYPVMIESNNAVSIYKLVKM